jgi:hypothetical protein
MSFCRPTTLRTATRLRAHTALSSHTSWTGRPPHVRDQGHHEVPRSSSPTTTTPAGVRVPGTPGAPMQYVRPERDNVHDGLPGVHCMVRARARARRARQMVLCVGLGDSRRRVDRGRPADQWSTRHVAAVAAGWGASRIVADDHAGGRCTQAHPEGAPGSKVTGLH